MANEIQVCDECNFMKLKSIIPKLQKWHLMPRSRSAASRTAVHVANGLLFM